jgi:hypothetical protein
MKGKSSNVLSRHESYLLCKWMDDRREHSGMVSAVDLAQEATKVLGFTVSHSNVYTTRQILNISPKNVPQGTSVLGKRVVVLEECVRRVYGRLGMPLPPSINGQEELHA